MIERATIIPSQERRPNFRELRPEEFWGGAVSIKEMGQEDFQRVMSETAIALGFTYSGYRVPKSLEEFEYHFSRYPRRKFGPVAPVEQYRQALATLGEKLKSGMREDTRNERPILRIVLGLQEGYEKETTLHTPQEIEQELGKDISITPVNIYSTGPWGSYEEPAVVIECDPTHLGQVYALAEKFNQARFAVEDLQAGQSHMVETKYCTDPDE